MSMNIDEARDMANTAATCLTAIDPFASDVRLEQIKRRGAYYSMVISCVTRTYKVVRVKTASKQVTSIRELK